MARRAASVIKGLRVNELRDDRPTGKKKNVATECIFPPKDESVVRRASSDREGYSDKKLVTSCTMHHPPL